jgi:hypothetical protein
MRRIPVKAVLQKAEACFAASRTEPGDTDGLSRDDLLTGLVHLDTWATVFWEMFFWPEWTIVERRQFRQSWSSATTYGAPTSTVPVEVYHVRSGKYAQSLRSGNLNQAPFSAAGVENSAYWAESASSYTADYDFASGLVLTVGKKVHNLDDDRIYQVIVAHTTGAMFDSTKFGILTEFKRSLAVEQSWETNALDAVRRITRQNPEVEPGAQEIEFEQIGTNYIVSGDASVIYVRFRERVPETGWRATIYDSATTYAVDDLVYADDPGEIYVSIAGSNTGNAVTDSSKWTRVDFPYVLRDAVATAIAAQWFKADGEADLAAQLQGDALSLAELEFEKVERQQGQSGRIPMKI